MNESAHCANFKEKHRLSRMSVAHIEKPNLTASNGNGSKEKMQGTLRSVEHLPDTLPAKIAWRARLRKIWGQLVVAKSVEGKYTVSQPLALSVLGFILIFGGTWYWRSSDTIQKQNDEIIELRTRLQLEKEKNIDQDSKIDQARATAQIADKNSARLEGKFDQFSQIYAIGNPKKARVQNGDEQ
jgi:hypothetical protein